MRAFYALRAMKASNAHFILKVCKNERNWYFIYYLHNKYADNIRRTDLSNT